MSSVRSFKSFLINFEHRGAVVVRLEDGEANISVAGRKLTRPTGINEKLYPLKAAMEGIANYKAIHFSFSTYDPQTGLTLVKRLKFIGSDLYDCASENEGPIEGKDREEKLEILCEFLRQYFPSFLHNSPAR